MDRLEETPSKKPRLLDNEPPAAEDFHSQQDQLANGHSSHISNGHESASAPTAISGDMPSLQAAADNGDVPFSSAATSSSPQPGSSINKDDDNISLLSGLSGSSGKEWKPDMTGNVGWLARAMAKGTNPKTIVADLFQDAGMLNDMDDNTVWQILFKMFAEPPKRQKLKEFNTLEDIAKHIKEASNILVLTGAGVSVSCGIPDFRSKDGVYARLAVDFPDLPDPQAMFDIQYFRKDPRPFFKFAKEIYPGQFTPSPCHRFISCLERAGKLLRNYTQNIDTLEQVAGISKVVQCHGSFATASCTKCKSKLSAEHVRSDIMEQKIPICPLCPAPDLDAILEEVARVQAEAARRQAEFDRRRAELVGRRLEEKAAKDDEGETLEKEREMTSGAAAATNSEDKDNSASSGNVVTHEDSKVSDSALTQDSTSGAGLENSQTSAENSSPGEPTSSTSPVQPLLPPWMERTSPFSEVPIMKPDIVFFGEGLSDEFHNTISQDKDKVDLLIVIGSSLKVRPVALIPSSIPHNVPQILINRERLNHLTFDVELLGDCDTVINQLCHMLEGDWKEAIHRQPLIMTENLPQLNQSLDESKDEINMDESGSSDNVKSPEGDSDSTKVPEGASDSTKVPEGSLDSARAPEGTSESAKSSEESLQKEGERTKESPKTDKVEEKDEDERIGAEHFPESKKQDKDNESPDESFDRGDEDWRPKPISELIPDGHFLFMPPNRYVFSGAEVFMDDLSDLDEPEDDEDDDDGDEEEEDGDEEEGPQTSSDQPDQELHQIGDQPMGPDQSS